MPFQTLWPGIVNTLTLVTHATIFTGLLSGLLTGYLSILILLYFKMILDKTNYFELFIFAKYVSCKIYYLSHVTCFMLSYINSFTLLLLFHYFLHIRTEQNIILNFCLNELP